MKEKTFEELVEEYTFYLRSDYAKKEPLLDKADVLKLLQQVREATIEECEQIAFNNLDFHSCNDVRDDLYNMDRDRIKTDK